MISNKYIAIDLGSSAITAMAAEVLPDGALRILGVETKPSDDINHGIIEQPSGAAFKVSEVYKLLQNSARCSDVDKISVCVGAKSMKSKQIIINRSIVGSKEVTDDLLVDLIEECKSKVESDDIAIFDVIPRVYELDGYSIDEPTGKKANNITGYYTVVYGDKIVEEKLKGCFYRASINLEYSPVSSEALSTAIIDDNERMEGCAIINFGASTTTLSIYKDDVLQLLKVVPLGGHNITKDIKELGISEENAEKLKCLTGTAMEENVTNPVYIQMSTTNPEQPLIKISTKFLATIIEARLDEIMSPILKILQEYKDQLKAGIIITGGASKLKELQGYLTNHTGLQVKHGTHKDWLVQNTPGKWNNATYSQLVGTIILTHEFRMSQPMEEEKEKQQPKNKKEDKKKKGIKDISTSWLFNFFSDENKMN